MLLPATLRVMAQTTTAPAVVPQPVPAPAVQPPQAENDAPSTEQRLKTLENKLDSLEKRESETRRIAMRALARSDLALRLVGDVDKKLKRRINHNWRKVRDEQRRLKRQPPPRAAQQTPLPLHSPPAAPAKRPVPQIWLHGIFY